MNDREKVQHALTILLMLALGWLGWWWATKK